MKRLFIREEILKKLANAGNRGLTIYDASAIGPGRRETISTNTATKILQDFEAKGLVTRKEEGFRGRKPYVIASIGMDVLEIARTVSKSRQSGKTITIGELADTYGEEKVNKAILACLLRYRVPPPMECEAISYLTRINFLQVIPSGALKKKALVVR